MKKSLQKDSNRLCDVAFHRANCFGSMARDIGHGNPTETVSLESYLDIFEVLTLCP